MRVFVHYTKGDKDKLLPRKPSMSPSLFGHKSSVLVNRRCHHASLFGHKSKTSMNSTSQKRHTIIIANSNIVVVLKWTKNVLKMYIRASLL
jgi:hypothetical protein